VTSTAALAPALGGVGATPPLPPRGESGDAREESVSANRVR
jgi:hypothetical protein